MSSITGSRFLSALFIIIFGLFFICSRAFSSLGCCGDWLGVYVLSICSTKDSKFFREWLMYCSMNCPAGGGSHVDFMLQRRFSVCIVGFVVESLCIKYLFNLMFLASSLWLSNSWDGCLFFGIGMKLRFNASASSTSMGNVVEERLKILLLFICISGKSTQVKQLSTPLWEAPLLAVLLLGV